MSNVAVDSDRAVIMKQSSRLWMQVEKSVKTKKQNWSSTACMDGSNRRIVTEMIHVRRKDKIDGATFRNESGLKHFSTKCTSAVLKDIADVH